MRVLMRTAAVLCLMGGLMFPGISTAIAGDLCPMGGTMVMASVDKDKAVEWLEDERRKFLLNEDGEWQIKASSEASDKIGIVLTESYFFFGVADDRDDREADERRINKAFGNEMRLLKDAVQKEVKAMRKAEVIDIKGGDVQKITDMVGLGVVSLDDDWTLTTEDCEGMTINLDELD